MAAPGAHAQPVALGAHRLVDKLVDLAVKADKGLDAPLIILANPPRSLQISQSLLA